MTFKELFQTGQNFEDYIKIGSEEEKEKTLANYSKIDLPMDLIDEIKDTKDKIYILASGEMWCPDCQLNITVVRKLAKINSNIKLSIINLETGKKYLQPLLDLKELKIPTMVILDKDFEKLGLFLEQPKNFKKLEKNDENRLHYLNGDFLIDTARELISAIKK